MYVPERVRKVEVSGCGVIALPDTRVRRSRQLSRSFAAVLHDKPLCLDAALSLRLNVAAAALANRCGCSCLMLLVEEVLHQHEERNVRQ